ncbi:MAG TPA: response regulator [Deltaproteobacteria bacterium]|nr:response regulator [Deltaproteobacteria bacterium]
MAKKILIVDDCATTRKLLSYIVRGRGYSIVTAENGIDALEKMAADSVDLILTDLNMPQMDGLELSRNLRCDEAYREIPIIMITTESGESDRAVAREAGVTSYLVKPISPQRLLYEIEKVI